MTPTELLYWQKVNRRIGSLTPDVGQALLKAFQTLRDSLTESELARLISTGQIDRLFDSTIARARLDAAFQPVRDRMRQGIIDGVKFFSRDLPKSNVTFSFDTLSPDVITAIRQLEARVLTSLQDDVKETVRAFVENGLRDGDSAATIAKSLRSVIGLSPQQESTVRNFRSLLETGDRAALERKLRDKRFDGTLDRVLGSDDSLSVKQVETMVDAYRRRMVARNAETIARTAASNAMKLAQRLSIDNAVKLGIYDGDRLNKTWVGVMDSRERPEHVAMEAETVAYDEPFSNGQMIPGEDEYNCRCIARYTQASQ